MKSRKLLRNKAVLWLFLGFFIIYLYFLINFKEYDNVWWDGASYIGMGKYLFSHGSQGVFEFIKPILLPVFLGIFWKLGFNAVIAGKLFIFLVSFLTLTFLYLSAKEIFNKKAGIIASIILFLNPLFFLFMYRIYTEMMSVCFILGSVFFMIKFSKQD
jgi:4-amino-4-deoxy-L-arabinose transferase-like glycosyltransferase